MEIQMKMRIAKWFINDGLTRKEICELLKIEKGWGKAYSYRQIKKCEELIINFYHHHIDVLIHNKLERIMSDYDYMIQEKNYAAAAEMLKIIKDLK